jgi:NAD+ kinase
MLEIKQVGVMCAAGAVGEPIERLRKIFAGKNINLSVLTGEKLTPPPDLVVSLGGDGTVLQALGAYPHVPLLPVNFGTTGFLTSGDRGELESLIARLLKGDYFIEERIILLAEIDGEQREVINEVVVKGSSKMVSVDVFVDDALIHTIRGDGAIVGTPTGSTSYLMSTGSAIVAPRVQCIILNGINEHRFASRTLILPDTSVVRLRVDESTRETDVFVSHDGSEKIPIQIGDHVTIRRAAQPWRLVFFDTHVFYRNLKNRLDW